MASSSAAVGHACATNPVSLVIPCHRVVRKGGGLGGYGDSIRSPGTAKNVITVGATHRFWPRSGVTFAPSMPRNAAESRATFDVPLRRLMRVYLANRGVWDAIVGAGPTCSVPGSADDVDAYVGAFGSLIGELTG